MESSIPQKTLLNYLRIIVGFLILIVLFLMITTTLKIESTPVESVAMRPSHLIMESEESIPNSVESLNFPVRAEPIASQPFVKFWEEFDKKIQDYITVGTEDAMKFQRANFRRAFLDARGMVADQSSGRVFTRTGVPVPVERLNCHLSGFNPERPHMIVNCP